MSGSGVKDNANPEIFAVETARAHTRRTPLEWSQLGSFHKQGTVGLAVPCATSVLFSNNENEDDQNSINKKDPSSFFPWIPAVAEDKAMLQCLVDVRHATSHRRHGGSGVHLLEAAGLVIPTRRRASTVLKQASPVFPVVSTMKKKTGTVTASKARPTATTQGSKDATARLDRTAPSSSSSSAVLTYDKIDAEEVFDIIRNIQDPEHPHTLEELGVVSLEQVELVSKEDEKDVKNDNNNINGPKIASTTLSPTTRLASVNVRFTPTIPHCSMATLIGLCIRVKLLRSLPSQFQVSVQIEPGTHASENAINKQMRDKERVCAALENKHLAGVVNKCIRNE